MKLANISLGNFRGYLAEKQIPLSPNLTILLGPNGFGKSTVLDAFEWLLSGQIARYQRRDEARRDDFIRHVDGKEEPYVQAMVTNGEQYILRRERRSIERSTLKLQRCEDELWMSPADSLDVLSKLDRGIRSDTGKGLVFSDPFIAYHLLGQQTMQEFVLSEPRDRYGKLAPIIGVERYVRATEAVLAANRKFLSMLDDAARKLNQRKADFEELKLEARGLDAGGSDVTQTTTGSAEWFASEYAELRNRLPETVKSKLPEKLPDGIAGTVDHLSGLLPDVELLLTAQVTDAERRLNLASSLERSLDSLDEKKRIEEGQTIPDDEQERYAALPRQVDFAEAQIRDLDMRITRLKAQSEVVQSQRVLIGQLKRAQSDHAMHSADLHRLNEEQAEVDKQASVAAQSLSDYLSEIARITQLIERSREASVAAASRLLAAEKLLAELKAVQSAERQAQESQKKVDDVRKEIGTLSAAIGKTNEELEQLRAAEVGANRELNSVTQSVRSYQQLLSQLRSYVAGSDCPVCGTHFPTREEILGRIDAKLSGDSPQLVQLSTLIQNLSQSSRRAQGNLETLTRNLRQCRREEEEAEQTVKRWTLRQDALRVAGAHIQLSIGTDLSNDGSLLETVLASLRQEDEKLKSQITEQASSLSAMSDNRASIESQIQRLKARLNRLSLETEERNRALIKTERDLAALARNLGQFNLSPQALEDRRLELISAAVDLQKQINEVGDLIAKASNERAALESELNTIAMRRERLSKTRQEIQQLESNISHRAAAIGLPSGKISLPKLRTIQQNISAELALTSESKSILETLINTLELARQRLLSEAHRARVANLAAEIDELQRKCENLNESKNITSVLAEKVRQAGERRTSHILALCNNLVENYYNRMYPHPLWSKLEMSVDEDPSRGGRAQLAISAKRNHVVNEGLFALDSARLNIKYSFSTGQLNLFALSLVLALAQLRHGEAFGTILLDDPVQAMDDIRVAELCWILLQISRTRQVVVATSNVNFVELLFHRAAPFRQNLPIVAHLFESITSVGPEILLNWRTNTNKARDSRVA